MASARASQDLSSASDEQLLRIKEELQAPMLHEKGWLVFGRCALCLVASLRGISRPVCGWVLGLGFVGSLGYWVHGSEVRALGCGV